MSRHPNNHPVHALNLSTRRTSLRLEPYLWDALHEISRREARTVHDICSEIDAQRDGTGLTAAVRVFILRYFREGEGSYGRPPPGRGTAQRSFSDEPS